MAITLTDLQTYNGGTVYANAVKAQAKLNQTINQVSNYLCYPIGVYGFADRADQRASTTFDSISVHAVPDRGINAGSVTLKKLTNTNVSIDVLYDAVPQTLTTTVPEVVISGLGSGDHVIDYGNYVWDVSIGANDVSILPRDKTTDQYWHVYPYKELRNIFLEPVNDVYQAVFIDCNDRILESVDEWTFDRSVLKVCEPTAYSRDCSKKDIRVAVLGDWYIPQDIETVIFDIADSAISAGSGSALAGTLKKEKIGDYSYELFGDATAATTNLDAHKSILDQYRICKSPI